MKEEVMAAGTAFERQVYDMVVQGMTAEEVGAALTPPWRVVYLPNGAPMYDVNIMHVAHWAVQQVANRAP